MGHPAVGELFGEQRVPSVSLRSRVGMTWVMGDSAAALRNPMSRKGGETWGTRLR